MRRKKRCLQHDHGKVSAGGSTLGDATAHTFLTGLRFHFGSSVFLVRAFSRTRNARGRCGRQANSNSESSSFLVCGNLPWSKLISARNCEGAIPASPKPPGPLPLPHLPGCPGWFRAVPFGRREAGNPVLSGRDSGCRSLSTGTNLAHWPAIPGCFRPSHSSSPSRLSRGDEAGIVREVVGLIESFVVGAHYLHRMTPLALGPSGAHSWR